MWVSVDHKPFMWLSDALMSHLFLWCLEVSWWDLYFRRFCHVKRKARCPFSFLSRYATIPCNIVHRYGGLILFMCLLYELVAFLDNADVMYRYVGS